MKSKAMMVLGLACWIVAASATALDDSHLVLYVPFEEQSGATVNDVSATKATGKIAGDVKWTKTGKFGGAAVFGGAANVEFADIPALNITKQITMTGWILPTDAPGDSSLWGRRTAANAGGYCMQWTAGKVETWLHFGGWKGTRGLQTITPKVGEWHFVSSVYDGKDLIQSVDGKEDIKMAAGGNFDAVAMVFRIGSAQTGLIAMNGTIDEVAVFDAALTSADLTDIREKGISAALAVSPSNKLGATWASLKTAR
jgi:hypothetical protein